MSNKKGRKSPYSTFKSAIKYYLVGTFLWRPEVALKWLNDNESYIRQFLATQYSPFRAAKEITSMRDKKK